MLDKEEIMTLVVLEMSKDLDALVSTRFGMVSGILWDSCRAIRLDT